MKAEFNHYHRYVLLTEIGCPFCAKALRILSGMDRGFDVMTFPLSRDYIISRLPALYNYKDLALPAVYDRKTNSIITLPRDKTSDWVLIRAFLAKLLED